MWECVWISKMTCHWMEAYLTQWSDQQKTNQTSPSSLPMQSWPSLFSPAPLCRVYDDVASVGQESCSTAQSSSWKQNSVNIIQNHQNTDNFLQGHCWTSLFRLCVNPLHAALFYPLNKWVGAMNQYNNGHGGIDLIFTEHSIAQMGRVTIPTPLLSECSELANEPSGTPILFGRLGLICGIKSISISSGPYPKLLCLLFMSINLLWRFPARRASNPSLTECRNSGPWACVARRFFFRLTGDTLRCTVSFSQSWKSGRELLRLCECSSGVERWGSGASSTGCNGFISTLGERFFLLLLTWFSSGIACRPSMEPETAASSSMLNSPMGEACRFVSK